MRSIADHQSMRHMMSKASTAHIDNIVFLLAVELARAAVRSMRLSIVSHYSVSAD